MHYKLYNVYLAYNIDINASLTSIIPRCTYMYLCQLTFSAFMQSIKINKHCLVLFYISISYKIFHFYSSHVVATTMSIKKYILSKTLQLIRKEKRKSFSLGDKNILIILRGAAEITNHEYGKYR